MKCTSLKMIGPARKEFHNIAKLIRESDVKLQLMSRCYFRNIKLAREYTVSSIIHKAKVIEQKNFYERVKHTYRKQISRISSLYSYTKRKALSR